MIGLKRTTSSDKDFRHLVEMLDRELWVLNGQLQEKFVGFNVLSDREKTVLAMEHKQAMGCGCLKELDAEKAEVKRMFVLPDHRQRGIGSLIMGELERWAAESGYKWVLLETSKPMQGALRFYKLNGYEQIENYPPYIGIEESVCMRKKI